MALQMNLNGPWEFRQLDKGEWQPACVPGSVHGDLLRAGLIPDPFAGCNELDTLWVGRADWEYRRTIELPDDFLAKRRQILVCEGLDTVATIWINGHKAAETDNMFRRYIIDAAPFFRSGANEIRVVFASPVREAERRAGLTESTLFAMNIPVTEPHRTALRKAQYQFGWDWGPCVVTAGIWNDIALFAYDAPRIEQSVAHQNFQDDGSVRVHVKAWLDVPVSCAGRLAVQIGENFAESSLLNLLEGSQTADVELRVDSPQLWWPNGQGQPHLYQMSLEWRDETGALSDRLTKRIGLRQIELVRESDSAGESFYLRVNGRPVYVKGANWIPADLLLERVTNAVYERDLRSCVAACMNTVRVWGGGIYERHAFYDLCDELGLMVWQDFMFACGFYPAEPWFLDNVEAEARHQIRRLHDHPCIALWCGNNENELALKRWWRKIVTPATVRDYEALYLGTLGRVAHEEDPNRPYWPSSPSNGSDGDPQDATRGDIHYWAVWHGSKPFATYETIQPRFCSEFGFQSLPAIETLRTIAAEKDLKPRSRVMNHHQRFRDGNQKIFEQMKSNLRSPKGFDNFCYASQVTQAMAIQTAVEHWRRLKPYCMGTIYWQLNDCWPVASWSSIDYAGRWKALHYAARRFFAPLLASSRLDDDQFTLWATSDLPMALHGSWQVEAWHSSGEKRGEFTGTWDLDPLASQPVAAIALKEFFHSHRQRDQILATFALQVDPECVPPETAKELGLPDAIFYADNTRLFGAPKAIRLAPPNITAAITQAVNGRPRIRLNCEKPALFVELSTSDGLGVFSDNWMHLIPGRETTIEFQGQDSLTTGNLRIRSLYDSYTRLKE